LAASPLRQSSVALRSHGFSEAMKHEALILDRAIARGGNVSFKLIRYRGDSVRIWPDPTGRTAPAIGGPLGLADLPAQHTPALPLGHSETVVPIGPAHAK
jgi:hypothetical protein